MERLQLLRTRFALFTLASSVLLPTSLSAQEIDLGSSDRATITLCNGDAARIKIGPEHAEPGDTRYPVRTYLGDTGVLVEFSLTAPAEGVRSRGAPPRLSDLVGNPERQAALDRAAKPGGWVTPPAASR